MSMGNPHAVITVNKIDNITWQELGPKIEQHPAFPRKTNVEFVQQLEPDRLRVKVWERGAGPTLACGTGACAVVVALTLTGQVDRKAWVELPGGELLIEWGQDDRVYMTGPATHVFDGATSGLSKLMVSFDVNLVPPSGAVNLHQAKREDTYD